MDATMTLSRPLRSPRALLLCIVLALLVACGGSAPTATSPAAAVPTATTAPAQAAASASAAPAATATTAAPAATTRPAAPPVSGTAAATPAQSGASSVPATPRIGATPRVTSYPLTVKDDAGRTVTVAKRPQRIVSLAPSNTEIAFALGLADRVAGVDQYSNFPAAAQAKPKVGSYSATNLEQVVAKEPDLILASGITNKDVLTTLEGQGLATVVLNPADLNGVLENISLVGQLADINADAAKFRGDLEARVAAVGERLKGTTTKPRVFLELDPTQFFSVGPKSFVDDLIARGGGANIAADTGTPYPKFSAEQIIARDPEVILLGDGSQGVTPDAVKARAGWAGVSAVKTGRIAIIDEDVFLRPGPRSVDALETMVRLLHPELFR